MILLPIFPNSPRRQPSEGPAGVLISLILLLEYYTQPPKDGVTCADRSLVFGALIA